MDNTKKTLKSPLSAKLEEVKAKAAGEAQRSIAGEVLFNLEFFKKRTKDTLERIKKLEKTLKEFMK